MESQNVPLQPIEIVPVSDQPVVHVVQGVLPPKALTRVVTDVGVVALPANVVQPDLYTPAPVQSTMTGGSPVAQAPGVRIGMDEKGYHGYVAPGATPPQYQVKGPQTQDPLSQFVNNGMQASPGALMPSSPAVEEKVDYVDELYQITSTSTAHDVWRIFDRKRRWYNRTIWAILWLTALGLFIAYFVAQLLNYLSAPTSTLILSQPETPQVFPSVALCVTTTNRSVLAQFLNNPGQGIGIGVSCGYGLAKNGSTGAIFLGETNCRNTARTEWIDFPFSIAPTACLRFNPDGKLWATTPGTTMTFLVVVPALAGKVAVANYQLLHPDEAIQPLLSNLIDTTAATKILYQKASSVQIKNCQPGIGSQQRCVVQAEQKCIENACNCKYPTVMNPETLPGSCELAAAQGKCGYGNPIYPCPKGLCPLEDICGFKMLYQQCPLPACEQITYFADSSTSPLPPEVQSIGAFAMSVVMRSINIQTINEVPVGSLLDFFGTVGGMMGLLLGFSVLTLFEWIEGCWRIGRDVEKDVVNMTDNDMVDAEAHANVVKPVKQA